MTNPIGLYLQLSFHSVYIVSTTCFSNRRFYRYSICKFSTRASTYATHS